MNTADRAQSYANAFYEAAFDRWLSSLDGVVRALEGNHALMQRLQADNIEFKDRQLMLDGLLPADADSLVRNLLNVLLQRGELSLLPEVAGALRARQRQTEAGPVTVDVTTAVPLAQDQCTMLETRLTQQHGQGLAFNYHVDPAILGGVIVRVGDKLIDGSVASRLAAMRQALGVTAEE
jgi:F-type H+-transporting ATPase subunit delta